VFQVFLAVIIMNQRQLTKNLIQSIAVVKQNVLIYKTPDVRGEPVSTIAVDGDGDPHIVKQVLSVRKIAFGVPRFSW